MCMLPESAGFYHYSNNWAGGMNVGTQDVNTFHHSMLDWTQPKFTSSCTSGEANYAIWAGLGGWLLSNGQKRLIQGGTNTVYPPPDGNWNVMYAWWEMLTTNTFNGMVKMGGPIPAGDRIRSDVYWNSNGYALMVVLDQTTGVSYSSGHISSLNGHNASYYFDGSTSDFIAEAPTDPAGDIEELRKPIFDDPVNFLHAQTNDLPTVDFNSWNITQGTSTHHIDDSTFDGVHGWQDTWRHCY